MKKFLLSLSILSISFSCFAQPYSGTIFIEPDIIIASDSSTLESVVYTGLDERVVFDRRANDWVTINAYIFSVVWNDGLNSEAVINPEFETVELAQVEAEKYGWHIGQLPTCLRTDVNEIWIHKGVEPFGGGNNSILIHTGQSVSYENNGILEETLVHEASHTSLDAAHAQSSAWLEAQNLDNEFISDYAEEFPLREDIAESFLLWIAVRHRQDRISEENFNIITETIPNRLNYFDGISCDLFPINSMSTASNEINSQENKIVVYPNPVTNVLYLKFNDNESYQADIYNSNGISVFTRLVRSYEQIELSNLPKGLYILTLKRQGVFVRKKMVIN